MQIMVETHLKLRKPLSIISGKSLTSQVSSSFIEDNTPEFQLADLRDSQKLYRWVFYHNHHEFKWAIEGFWIPESHSQGKGMDLNFVEGTKTVITCRILIFTKMFSLQRLYFSGLKTLEIRAGWDELMGSDGYAKREQLLLLNWSRNKLLKIRILVIFSWHLMNKHQVNQSIWALKSGIKKYYQQI